MHRDTPLHPGAHARSTPDKPAVVMADGRSIGYAELEKDANRLAHLFRSAGLRRGDHIALLAENRPEFFVVVWAAQRSGLHYTPCSTLLNAEELGRIVNDCTARVFVATDATIGAAREIDAPAVERRLLIGGRDDVPVGWEPLETALAGRPATPIADEAEGATMLYSSGTTGRPKGVKPPLPTEAYPHDPAAEAIAGLFGITETTVHLSPAPLYHAAPLFLALIVHRMGGTVVLQERFDAEEFLRSIERHRVTFTQVVPTMFIRLLRLPGELRGKYDRSSLRGVVHTAAPCPVEVKERMIEWWGPVIHEYYTGTEGCGFVYCDCQEWLARKGTVGRAMFDMPVHVLGEDGAELPAGRPGTIYFEGSSPFEYHRDPEQTRGTRDPRGRGWSTLGDIGYLDADGFLYLIDRRAYVINSGGVNIYPQEAENVLALHPKVADAAVFGVPDEEMGERVHAVVEPAGGLSGSAELAAELIDHCRERIAHYKCPRSIDFRSPLPRHPTGKLYKRLLREEYLRDRLPAGPAEDDA
jgi:acyl-CoA synthetase (AMP-forming)/AMP-acid ligase II